MAAVETGRWLGETIRNRVVILHFAERNIEHQHERSLPFLRASSVTSSGVRMSEINAVT
jgi:hypothetical protein